RVESTGAKWAQPVLRIATAENIVATASIEQRAFDATTRAGIAEIADALQRLFGQKLTAVLGGVQNPKAVSKWAGGGLCPHKGTAQRLRNVFHVVQLLAQLESEDTVRAWFTGMNPSLDDDSPAMRIADEPTRVLQAARSFLATG